MLFLKARVSEKIKSTGKWECKYNYEIAIMLQNTFYTITF
jgi:hypothetical protein